MGVALALLCRAALADPFALPAEDIDLVRAEISTQMLDPESTILSEVVAADEKAGDETMTWVCGKVRGKNTFGGYAQPVPFVGSIITEKTGKRSFLPIQIAGPSNSEQLAVLQLCLAKLGR